MPVYYIVPALTDQAGQCHIVRHTGNPENPKLHYQRHPEQWAEAGLINSRGRLVCLQANPDITQDIKGCEPLMAGMLFHY